MNNSLAIQCSRKRTVGYVITHFWLKKCMTNRREFHPPKNSGILLAVARWLRCPVGEVFRFSEVGGLQFWIFSIPTYGNQFLTEQGCYIDPVFLRGQAEEDPANMGGSCEVRLIYIPRGRFVTRHSYEPEGSCILTARNVIV